MHLYTYQMFYRNCGDEKALQQDVGKLVDRLLRDGITAICVFDGNTAGKKPEAHRKRREAADKVQVDLAQTKVLACALSTEEHEFYDGVSITAEGSTTCVAGSIGQVASESEVGQVPDLKRRRIECEERIQKLEARAMKPNSGTFEVVKAVLISGLGEAAVVTADDDAERYVSYLCRTGDVDFAASGDYDTLVFGSPNVILDFLKPDAMLVVRLDEVISALGLSDLAAFRDFCILCGCDFCTKIPGVGPVSALKLVVAHGSIEGIYGAGKHKRTASQDFDYVFARQRFSSSDGGCSTHTTATAMVAHANGAQVLPESDTTVPAEHMLHEKDTSVVAMVLNKEDAVAHALSEFDATVPTLVLHEDAVAHALSESERDMITVPTLVLHEDAVGHVFLETDTMVPAMVLNKDDAIGHALSESERDTTVPTLVLYEDAVAHALFETERDTMVPTMVLHEDAVAHALFETERDTIVPDMVLHEDGVGVARVLKTEST